ncbi:competence protein CoiA [Cytobacillus massiliigabonensis]|uniref:competence protein CoiA n=1 Tax=Cytobacillus massiliigabonensis TaxID=1871011 RepID=UPI0015E07E5C|nr:competence protein CoiA family protein [Cytobacillus massiliigabonensis]
MLVSKTKCGEWISLTEVQNQEKLKEIRRKEIFFCPECSEQVILKIGTKRISHFAHKVGSVCADSYERESEYHLRGKILLYKWLDSLGLKPSLEPYYQEISQRPDISFVYEGVQYAIEYQCSVIPEELFMKRTNNYYQANIVPIWIMSGKNIKRKGSHKAALSSFDYLFLSKSPSEQWRIPAFCPITNTLISLHSILPVTVKNVITNYSMIPIEKAQLADLLNPSWKQLARLIEWQNEMKKQKDMSPLYGGQQNKFLQDLYNHSLIPSLLPPEIGLPVSNAPFIETSVLKWQCYLLMDVFHHQRSFSMKEAIHAFRKRVQKGDIKIRNLPLVKEGNGIAAVNEYIQLLVQVNYLKMLNQNYFQLARKQYAENYSNQEKMAKDFYQEYGKLICNHLNKVQ